MSIIAVQNSLKRMSFRTANEVIQVVEAKHVSFTARFDQGRCDFVAIADATGHVPLAGDRDGIRR